MSRGTIKIWYLIHKWSGLIPTVFLLMLCVTGLPLIFHDEIDAAMGADSANALAGEPSAEGGLPLDRMLAAALAERPGEVPLFMAFSPDSPLLTVTTGPTPDNDHIMSGHSAFIRRLKRLFCVEAATHAAQVISSVFGSAQYGIC